MITHRIIKNNTLSTKKEGKFCSISLQLSEVGLEIKSHISGGGKGEPDSITKHTCKTLQNKIEKSYNVAL